MSLACLCGRKDGETRNQQPLSAVGLQRHLQCHCSRHTGEAQVHPTSALDGGEWFTSRPCRFAPGKEPQHPSNTKLRGPHRQSGRFEENKNLFPLPGFGAHTVQPEAYSLYRQRYSGS